MKGLAAPKLAEIRIGIVGMGQRGQAALERFKILPGVKVLAICDINSEKLARSQQILKDGGKPSAKEYLGAEAYRALCEDDRVNVVYNTMPWGLRVPVALAAMRGGKHVFTEVPGAFTVDECWELVETSEKTQQHCMQLESCCYGEIEMLTFNLAKLGMLGELIHGEGAYIHDLRNLSPEAYQGYVTHGLLPLCLTMDVNRGDRLDYLVSMDSRELNFALYKKNHLKIVDPQFMGTMKAGDINTSLIRTALGKTIMIQHDVSSPRPYTRLQLVSGTKGIVADYPFRIALEEADGAGAHGWFGEQKANEILEKYRHPLQRTLGELAKRVGRQGGSDFIMDARWVYCLEQGLPLDTDVYDLATSCCLGELTANSAKHRSRAVDIPDFTRGAWKESKSMEIVDIELRKFGLRDA